MIREMTLDELNDLEVFKTDNKKLQSLKDYHFDRKEMCEVFDSEFTDWLYDVMYKFNDEFHILHIFDSWYIIHFDSGTIISWYKHMGRCNTCNKNLTIKDLKEFKRLLLASYGYVEE